jgi:hypothetical protein
MLGAAAVAVLLAAGGFLGLVAPRLGGSVLWLAVPVGVGLACAFGLWRAKQQVGDACAPRGWWASGARSCRWTCSPPSS